MKLYGFFRSSAAFRVRIALNLKGADYEQVPIHLRRSEQSEEPYLALNPQGLVPTLEDEGDTLLQSLAIIEYLDETIAQPPLLPGHPGDRARVRGLAQVIACDIHPINNLRVMRYLASQFGQDQKALDTWTAHWINLGFEALEALLAGDDRTGRFCHGDTPGLADICLVPQVFNARRIDLDLTPYLTIARITDSCLALDAFDRARPEHQPDCE
jgi:maleylacetoacetate isomerase